MVTDAEELLSESAGRKTPEDNFFSRPDTPMDDIDKLDLDDKKETLVKGPALVKVMDDPEAKVE